MRGLTPVHRQAARSLFSLSWLLFLCWVEQGGGEEEEEEREGGGGEGNEEREGREMGKWVEAEEKEPQLCDFKGKNATTKKKVE